MGAKLVRVDVKWDAGDVAARLGAARERALGEAGEYILNASRQIAPLRSGALRASGRAEVSGNAVRVGYFVPYALLQHENTHYRHPNGGRAKFLSSVLENPATAQRVAQLCAAALRDALN